MKKKELERLKEIEATIKSTSTLVHDLVEMLERTKIISATDDSFASWREDLFNLRYQEQKTHQINKAEHVLKDAGFFVVQDKNELDAAKLQKWCDSGKKTNLDVLKDFGKVADEINKSKK